MSQEVTFVAVRDGTNWVVDLITYNRLARTGVKYASEEAAKSAATSMWRAMQAQQRVVAA